MSAITKREPTMEWWDSCHKCGIGDWWREGNTVSCDRCGWSWTATAEWFDDKAVT